MLQNKHKILETTFLFYSTQSVLFYDVSTLYQQTKSSHFIL